MDHHCPWINGCVGYQNHRHFALFLFYVAISTTYVTILNIPIYFTNKFNDYFDFTTDWFRMTTPLNVIIALGLSLFSYWNWYLILKGKTSIEFWGSKANK